MWQMLALTVSLAYFVYDTICCAVELPFSWEMLIHHALTILGLAYGYVRQVVSASNYIQLFSDAALLTIWLLSLVIRVLHIRCHVFRLCTC